MLCFFYIVAPNIMLGNMATWAFIWLLIIGIFHKPLNFTAKINNFCDHRNIIAKSSQKLAPAVRIELTLGRFWRPAALTHYANRHFAIRKLHIWWPAGFEPVSSWITTRRITKSATATVLSRRFELLQTESKSVVLPLHQKRIRIHGGKSLINSWALNSLVMSQTLRPVSWLCG